MSQDSLKLEPYPIQMMHLVPRELYILSQRDEKNAIPIEETDIELQIGNGGFNAEENSIVVSVKLEIGSEKKIEDAGETKIPFYLRIELLGFFTVDATAFPIEKIDEWAWNNAVFIMHPYLREHAYSLTARAGYIPLLLPLVQVPTIKLTSEKEVVNNN